MKACIGCLILLTLALILLAQPAAANEACMKIVYSGKPTDNAEITKNDAFQFKIPAASRNAIASALEQCLNKAYADKRSGRAVGREPYGYRQWFTRTADGFDFCTTYDPIVAGEGIVVHCDHQDRLPDSLF
jgi:hypothetical protein